MLSLSPRQVGVLYLLFFFPNTSKSAHEKKKGIINNYFPVEQGVGRKKISF